MKAKNYSSSFFYKEVCEMVRLQRRQLLQGALGVTMAALQSGVAAQTPNLDRFYIHHNDPLSFACCNANYKTEFLPQVRVIGGGVEPEPRPDRVTGTPQKSYNSIHRLVGILVPQLVSPWEEQPKLFLYAAWSDRIMTRGPAQIVRPVLPNTVLFQEPALDGDLRAHDQWYATNNTPSTLFIGAYEGFATPPPTALVTSSVYTVRAPVRRTAIDGGQYDASPLEVTRGGVAWYNHYWGYRLGLVANESTFDNLNRSQFVAGWPSFPSSLNNFELAALPPPWVEDDVVEYVNRADFPKQPGGQFFYAVLAADKNLLDSVPNWSRTGKAFKSGGYVSVCRFYGGKNGGPNTHFYSADDKECAALKAVPQLSYEGQTFAVNMPMPGSNADGTKACPIDSKPLYRLYNNASAPGKDYVSNHRYVTERTDVAAAVAQGWVDEGQVMCVPM